VIFFVLILSKFVSEQEPCCEARKVLAAMVYEMLMGGKSAPSGLHFDERKTVGF
jgi:hypothetical protein